MTNPTFGSLFAGVGGIDIGLERAGWDCQFQVEWDKNCQQTLAYHWPDVPRWGDVSEVSGADLPLVDMITFGSPCQDLSTAGKRAGLVDGSRSNLFFQAIRIIKEMRDVSANTFPRWALWENVPGAFSSNQGADFGAVLDAMADLGALAVEWHCLDAQFFGVPQRRRRVFVLACFDPGIRQRGRQPVLPVPEGRRGDSPSRQSARKDSARSASESAGGSGESTPPGGEDGPRDGWGTGVIGALCATDDKWIQQQQVMQNKLILQPEPMVFQPGMMLRGSQKLSSGPVPTLRAEAKRGDNEPHLLLAEETPRTFVKQRRAQSEDDYETWVETDVAPTLNVSDNTGPVRATTIVLEPTLLRMREGKPGGGKGPLLSEGFCPTLGTSNDLVLFVDEQVAIPIQDGREIEKRQNGLGIGQPGDPSYTLDSTGGQAVAQAILDDSTPRVIVFEPGALARGLSGDRYSDEVAPTLRAHMGDNQPAVAQPVVSPISHAALRGGGIALTPSPDGKGGESIRHPGFGLGEPGDPMYSLTTEPPAVAIEYAEPIAYPIQGTIVGRSETSGPQGLGVGLPGEPMYTLDLVSLHYVATTVSETKENTMPESDELPTHPKLLVRRLTPRECERLMGWPDDHTLYRADGKTNSDSTRYKMCGNGVASPVAEWIGRYIKQAQDRMDDKGE